MITLKKFENGVCFKTLETKELADLVSELEDYTYCGSGMWGHKTIGNMQAVVTFK